MACAHVGRGWKDRCAVRRPFSPASGARVAVVLSAVLCSASRAGAEKVYTNEKLGYSVTYPDNWFPSGNTYSNAFEIRNYDPKMPQSVPEKDRANLTIVDTFNDTAEATDKFLDGLGEPPLARARAQQRIRWQLTFDGRRAIRVRQRLPVQRLGPGVTRSRSQEQPADQAGFYFAIAIYVADGKHVLSMEASAPAEADATVINEVIRIQDSLKFTSTKRPD
jgi:hypothetical protein